MHSFFRKWRNSLVLAFTFALGVLSLPASKAQEALIEVFPGQQTHVRPAKLTAAFKPIIREKIYVPLYSHIYQDNSRLFALLAGTLSIRNTDANNELILISIAYYNTQGQVIRELCKEPFAVAPMATAEIIVPRGNRQGGSGASFTVEWMADRTISEPIIESVMISSGSAKEISLISRGVVISRTESSLKDGRTLK